MALTRSDIETELVQRTGHWLTAGGLDGTTINGSNLSLNAPIGWAIRTVGGTVVAPSLVTSTDVQTVAAADYDKFLLLAELRTLQNVLASYALVDAKAGPVEAKASQLADRIERRIGDIKGELSYTYGYGGYGAFSLTLTRTDGYSELAAE